MKLIFEIIFITRLKNDTKSCKCRCYFFKTKTVETKLLEAVIYTQITRYLFKLRIIDVIQYSTKRYTFNKIQ